MQSPSLMFEKHQKLIEEILTALSKHPMRRKQLLSLCIAKEDSLYMLSKSMRWMQHKGYIKKSEEFNRLSPYEITENGKKFLEGLKV